MDSRWSIQGEPFREGNITWVRCKCVCGTIRNVRVYALKGRRPSKSCGCLRREVTAKLKTRHGQTGTKLYNIWLGMHKRCNDRNSVGYANYGGRGIRVCNKWKQFEAFACWARSNGFKTHLTLDRIHNSRGYSPSNCQFATRQQQSLNRRTWGISKYRGVSFDKRCQRWYCYVGNGKSRKKLGMFKTELAAHRRRCKYLREAG